MNLRDARHHALPQVGERGQARIAATHVLAIGAGGIGTPCAAYLAACGVGQIDICDFDRVDATNLGRQILYTPDDIDRPKAEVLAARLQAQNPDATITSIGTRLTGRNLRAAVDRADIVLDGSDNFATRFEVSDACVAQSRTLVSGAAIRLEGQLAVFGPDYGRSPCYRCLYSEADESLEDCAGNGVLAPVPAVIGTLMAVEALKRVVGHADDDCELRLYDGVHTTLTSVRITKRPDCPTCSVQ